MTALRPPVSAVMAEFSDPDALVRAVESVRQAGYTRLDVFSPFPMRDLALTFGWPTRALRVIAVVSGAVGAAVQYGSQYWMNAVDYPLNVGGRPLHAWPAFLPSTVIVAILWAGAATLIGMLLILRLPRLHYPVFGARGFERASQDRFFLSVRADDPQFEVHAVARLLETEAPGRVQEVGA